MTGLQQEVRDRILGSNPHIFVWKQGGIDDYPAEVAKLRQVARVIGAAPGILDKALVTAGDAEMAGALGDIFYGRTRVIDLRPDEGDEASADLIEFHSYPSERTRRRAPAHRLVRGSVASESYWTPKSHLLPALKL
jgi:hypothetical protein